MLSALNISTSGLTAQRTRMNAIASNMANITTTRNERGDLEPYQPRFVMFQTDEDIGQNGGAGVKVPKIRIDSNVQPVMKYDPGSPDAIQEGEHKGSVAYPGVNMMNEMTNSMEAARSYEANLGAFEISKDMANQTLRIIA
jgi:flagellar basal-body rod protein FlgC